MAKLEYPMINASTLPGQMEQVRRYLFQFAEQLQFALSTLEEDSGSGGIRVETRQAGGVKVEKVSTFEELKSLIVSSADIVQSIASETKRIFDGSGAYVAKSDFGEYQEQRRTILDVDEENGVTLLMTEVQRIEVDEQGEERTFRGCIRIGKVTIAGKDDREVYGVSVGQVMEEDGKRTYTTSARYRSDGVDFYDEAGNRVAYILTTELGESKLFIEDAEVRGTLTVGECIIDPSDGLAFSFREDE